MRVVIHTNIRVAHQRAECEALLNGFKKHGITAHATTRQTDPSADINVVLGPYYALPFNRDRPRVFYIDRSYYWNTECNSVHWVQPDTEKIFIRDSWVPRARPELKPKRSGCRAVLLLDHIAVSSARARMALINQATTEYDGRLTIRFHPVESSSGESLEDCLSRHDVAIGARSTALVDAAIAGLEIKTTDKYSPVYPLAQGVNRQTWINDLSMHNWRLAEIESGEAWEFFSTGI